MERCVVRVVPGLFGQPVQRLLRGVPFAKLDTEIIARFSGHLPKSGRSLLSSHLQQHDEQSQQRDLQIRNLPKQPSPPKKGQTFATDMQIFNGSDIATPIHLISELQPLRFPTWNPRSPRPNYFSPMVLITFGPVSRSIRIVAEHNLDCDVAAAVTLVLKNQPKEPLQKDSWDGVGAGREGTGNPHKME